MNAKFSSQGQSAVSPDLEARVIGRKESLFAGDRARFADALREQVTGKRILVGGGGGSIGSSTVGFLSELAPSALHVVDLSENYLAELVRDLRARPEGLAVSDFRTLPLDYGSPIMERFLAESAAYDCVLNFAALKHVRSEKDLFSLLQMLDTNVVKHIRFKRWLEKYGHGSRYFAVSTDKAANPSSLMGASKRLMEDVVFDVSVPPGGSATSARFANVAFSNGSLLQGFLCRLSKHQPLAVPRETRRYFVSQAEAGEICLLTSLAGPAGHVLFPNFDPATSLILLEQVAIEVLRFAGFEPELYEDEEAARRAVAGAAARGRWPVLVTALDTSGEKPFEEFVAKGEEAVQVGFGSLNGIAHAPGHADSSLLYDRLSECIGNPARTLTKADLVSWIAEAVPGLQHQETGRDLDQRL